MSLPLLVNGADCGPTNPLQGLSKRFDQDRGIQQDHFGTGRAGPSREAFRSQYSAAAGASQEAANFFSTTSPPLAAGPSVFDLNALQASLPAPQSHSPAALTPQQQTPARTASWAADFIQYPAKQSPVSQLPQSPVPQAQSVHSHEGSKLHMHGQVFPSSGLVSNVRPWSPMMSGYGMNGYASMVAPPHAMPVQSPVTIPQLDVSGWEKAFQSHENMTVPEPVAEQFASGTEQQSHGQPQQDELARTAGRLMEAVANEQNPKFKSSEFMGLMRQLRDGEVVVDGDKMVPKDSVISQGPDEQQGNSQRTADMKGKGRAVEPRITSFGQAPNLLHSGHMLSPVSAPQGQVDEVRSAEGVSTQLNYEGTPIDAYFREENERYIEMQRQMHPEVSNVQAVHHALSGGLDADWGRLQHDWDSFEATATGIRPLAHYEFQSNNPYSLGEASRTRHHSMHSEMRSSVFENVLELEAAVQRDPTNALRWFELGVKQQENEREQKAVQALRRSLELDPSHLPSWLALAVSYTNENNRRGAYGAVREWVDRNDRYRPAVEQFKALNPETDDMVHTERFGNLIQCLISVARSDTSGVIDADIQIALAVLLNTNEEYAKAQDCFSTALAVRPDDWLLYNRVGATLANNGRPEEALQYYYRALELNPTYIRARFNLGISCINLRRYEEAAQHILDALVLQDGDSVYERTGGGDKRGVTSHSLWESLKTCCLHMQRIDLATLCDREDLEAFRLNFQL